MAGFIQFKSQNLICDQDFLNSCSTLNFILFYLPLGNSLFIYQMFLFRGDALFLFHANHRVSQKKTA